MRTQPKNTARLAAIGILVLVAIMSRFLPYHPWNVSATGAAALFAGAAFGLGWAAFLVPIASLWVSDLILNNLVYSGGAGVTTWSYPGMGYTYAGYVLAVLMGALLLKKPGFVKVAAVSVGASLLFFLVSNFGVWATADQYPVQMYPKTWEGLVACYTLGLPFLRNTLLGDLFFTEAFFLLFAWAQARVPALRSA